MKKDIGKNEVAVFGAGCFWGVEYVFKRAPGVVKTEAGYMGGKMKSPTYEEVCNSDTGHAEVLKIEFDPGKIKYAKLLEVFFKCHDPTTMNRQGPDVGNQYRSVIFYYSNEQKKEADKSKKEWQKLFKNPIVTEITKAGKFYPAESYHQNYYDKKKGVPYCHVVPKIDF